MAACSSNEKAEVLPPGRVRHLFKKLDTNKDGRLTLDELQAGFVTEFSDLSAAAQSAIPSLFEQRAENDPNAGKSLSASIFSRFYAQILFIHFDTNQDGVLQLDEAQEALKFLVKSVDGVKPELSVAFPPEAYSDTGELRLPMSWFWSIFSSME